MAVRFGMARLGLVTARREWLERVRLTPRVWHWNHGR